MHPIHDADLILLLAVTLASKRKPATVEEIALALGTLQPRLPAEDKLLDAFARLSSHGLILAHDAAFALSAEGETLMRGVPAKGETADRAAQLKRGLAAFEGAAVHPVAAPIAADLSAAIAAWRASLPPPTKSEKFAQRQEDRIAEEKARRKAEGWRPRGAMPGKPKGPGGAGKGGGRKPANPNAGFGSPKRSTRGR